MQFVHANVATGVSALSKVLSDSLSAGKRTLWLVSGGSNIPISVDVMAAIPDLLTSKLTIMLVDERYGPVGHSDSNAQQLQDAGLAFKHGEFIPALTGESLKATVTRYNDIAKQQFQENDAIVAQLGVGLNGYIAGLLPHSAAVTAPPGVLVAGYEGPDFTRLTMTFEALSHIQTAFAFVYGETKRTVLEQLRSEDLPLDEQAAQFLKRIPKAYVYNDQLV
jgi:6-phosphogluconolactonase/glucosamine-6-phosphate isomerase/deaminase